MFNQAYTGLGISRKGEGEETGKKGTRTKSKSSSELRRNVMGVWFHP